MTKLTQFDQLSLFEICLKKRPLWIKIQNVEVGDILINLCLQPRASDWNEVVTKIEHLDLDVTITLESGGTLTKPWYSLMHVLVDVNREVETF